MMEKFHIELVCSKEFTTEDNKLLVDCLESILSDAKNECFMSGSMSFYRR